MRLSLRWLGLVGLLAVVVLSTACEPYAVPRELDHVQVDLNITARGGAAIDLFAAPGRRPQLAALTAQAARALLPQAGEVAVSINGNDGGYPFGHASIHHVYQPGANPVVDVRLDQLAVAMSAHQIDHTEVNVCPPRVPTRVLASPRVPLGFASCVAWDSLTGSRAQRLSFTLKPQPSQWLLTEALTLLSGILGLAALAFCLRGRPLMRRRRWQVGGLAVLAIVVGAPALIGTTVKADNLGVSGEASGIPLVLARVAPVAVILAIVLALVVATLGQTLDRPQSRVLR